jgi:hypothetical protein
MLTKQKSDQCWRWGSWTKTSSWVIW